MCQAILHLLILMTLSCHSLAENETNVTCPDHQRAFGGSCFEFVGIQRSFFSAEAWCEENGGHLAFIPDEDTQYFLQRHMDTKEDMWFGVAASAEGHLSWLDGSPITYSKWVSSPQPGSTCGYILRDSGFHWEATNNCSKKQNFICEFESERTIVCEGHNTTLQCGSGQVLMIDGGFYGRKSIHYCPSKFSPPTSPQHQCGWVDAVESITAQCHGRQVCQVAEVVNSFAEPCPQLKSYLSVDYHCKDGLLLSVNTTAAVFDDVRIQVKWLLHSPLENLSCRVNTGDDHVIYLNNPKGLESSAVHKYTHPSTFIVTAECTSSETNITAQEIITIQEPVAEIGVMKCYAGNLSFNETNCKALYGEALHIQMEVKAGTNVVYTIKSDEKLLSGLSVVGGTEPHNITMASETVKLLGSGCHLLTLYASNTVTMLEVSKDLQVCILEKIAGLQVSVLTASDECLDSPFITFGVSLERGEPVLLLFSLTGDDSLFTETRQMNTRKEIFQIEHPVQGSPEVKLRAYNVFSSLEVLLDISASCGRDLAFKQSGHNGILFGFNKRQRRDPVSAGSSQLTITASPSASITTKQPITLSVTGLPTGSGSQSKDQYKWKCEKDCKCDGASNTVTYTIQNECLPDPFEFDKYYFKIGENEPKDSDSICITLTPSESNTISLTCTEGCDSVQSEKDTKIIMQCTGTCPKVIWSIEDSHGKSETRSCYDNANTRPLKKKQTDGNEFEVDHDWFKKESDYQVTVVVTTMDDQPLYKKYTIQRSPSSSSSPSQKPTPKPGASTNNDQPGAGTIPTAGVPTIGTTAPSGLSCIILPQSGTMLDTFSITCSPGTPCPNCQYCFKTQSKQLQCSQNGEVKSIFLPPGDSSSNYNLNIIATATTDGPEVLTTTITVQVQDSSADSVANAVDQLKANGKLSVETTGQLFTSVANNLNSQTDPSGKADRQKLREKMLDTMTDALKTGPTTSPQEAQMLAGALVPLVKTGAELSTSAQEGAALLFANLSSSLLHMGLNASDQAAMLTTTSTIVEGLSNILDYSSNENTSGAILDALNNIQSALLLFKQPDEEPTIIQQTHVNVFVRRVSPAVLHTNPINIANCSCPAFSLPKLPPAILPSEEPVDVRMLSFDKSPFSWKEGGNISGFIGSLSLSTKNGSGIPVENISEDIQILLPRPAGEQVNTSILYLGNFSTTVIDIPSAEATLVLKMMPSKDPLPFKVLLGYDQYPTETNYVAATEMPQQGSTQEEKYTWMLHPEDLKGNTGVHYLVVRPIVGPGIKSINASLSITPITASCKFWNESQLDWSNYGCRVGVNTTQLETQCLCNHLTFFGSSFFVTPNLVDPSRTAELFATFANNPVVVCFVGALFVAYLLVVVWARRKDIQDTAKVKVTVLEDNDRMDEYRYLLSICTGHRIGASTSSQVTVTLLGTEGNSEPHHLTDSKKRVFERGAVDMFLLTTPFSLGDLQGIRLWHNNSGSHPAWYVGNVMVQDLETKEKWHFLCNSWLSIDIDDCSLDKVFPVSTETDLKGFSNLFFMKTTKDFNDGHLWYSVISRPPSSNFTCVQRVSCCFSLLLCTMLTSIMFYGIPTDPSEQTMDLGAFQFTWQQFMIGIESSLIMFPVNILIVSIFRFTRPRETSCCQRKNKNKNSKEQASVSSQTATLNTSPSASLDVLIKDITKIANSLSKTAKSNVPSKQCEFGPGQQNDINAILSVVNDFIKQNKTTDYTEPKTQTRLSDNKAYVHSASTEGVTQKKSNKTHHLYRQLCRIDTELSQLGPSSFPDPHSYKQALHQVQSMKSMLEDQLYTSNSVSPHELTSKTASPSGSTDVDGSQKKRTCCHGGLPWWFVFVGWLLVVATSVISGYFTMLYGLKFGKERSISWLVSMIISFFQSIFFIQPLKVLCIAIFFALVIKKVDEEDLQNVPFERSDRNIGDSKDQQIIRQLGGFYEPPPPADIERMRRNMIMEQKAFALLREILIYIGFLWMLLLVAHGQRDPNAFYLNSYITQSFCGSIQGSMSDTDIFTWANTTLLTNLFGVNPGFITDGNSKLVGNARLRQLRVQKKSCQTASVMLEVMPDCNAPYSWGVEDMGSYEPGWNKQAGDNISTSTSSPWKYQAQDQLRAYPTWGQMVLYRGGGFAVELGPDLQNASSTLEDLFSNKWLDMYTRAVFVEFTVYNANVNLFCIVTLLIEATAVGAFQLQSNVQSIRLYPSTATLQTFVMTAEIIYLLFILYYMFIQGKLMKQQRWLYFKNKWNLLDLSIIILSWSAVAVFAKRTLLGNRDITYYQNHKDKFASFYETATADSLLQYLIAFLVLLATVKLWHLLRFNSKMNMMTAALQRASATITGLLMTLAVMLVAYSIACNLIYGWTLSSYKTFVDSLMTIICLQIGIFNYDEVLDNNPLLGGLIICSCIVFMTFVVLSLLLSVIMEAFSQEQKHHKPSEEDEIVDLLLRKIYSLFGIRSKHTKDTREPPVNGSSVYSRNILNTSTPDVNIF